MSTLKSSHEFQSKRRMNYVWITLVAGFCFVFVSWKHCATTIHSDVAPPLTKDSKADNGGAVLDWKDLAAIQRSRLFSKTSHNDCHAGALCVGPGHMYPIGRQVGVSITGQFVVPALPKSFDVTDTTYYDYINIFWRQNVYPGYMNQFVPQLMLGNALATSTNHPDYKPQWIKLNSWHVGAQYFMAICTDDDNHANKTGCDNWSGRAATGELIAVEPGEGVFTKFELVHVSPSSSQPSAPVEWHLTMGVVGDPYRVSKVVVPRPFMGLVANTTSWMEEIYDMVYVGSCLENYGMERQENYPGFWKIDMNIQTAKDATTQPLWQKWGIDHDRSCVWQPKSIVESTSNVIEGSQTASWTAYLEK